MAGKGTVTKAQGGSVSTVRLFEMRDAGVSTGRVSSLILSGRAWLLNSSRWRVTVVLGSVAVLFAVLSFAAGYPAWWGGVAVLGVAVVALFAAWSASALKTAIALLLFFPFAPLVGFYYAAFMSGSLQTGPGDAGVGALGLLLALLFVAVGSLRWGRGRAWVTVAVAAVSFIVPGLVILAAVPHLGFLAAWGSAASVAAARWGGWTWLVSVVLKLVHRGAPLPAELPVSSVPVSFAIARVPDGYAVFSPRGVTGVVVADTNGPVEETRKVGVVIPGVDVGEATVRALRAAKHSARLSGSRRAQVAAVVLVRGRKCLTVDKTVGVFVSDSGEASAAVRVLGESAFLEFIGAGPLTKRMRRLCLVASHRNRNRQPKR